jgi:prepilin-type N-terminal cleavage/methylation domain-containing protein/prepilin-type processing-associated H-X9-DG protein
MRHRVSAGFTLLELLVVLAIIAILAGLFLAAVQKTRAAASRARCQNNLRQIGTACHNFAAAGGRLPPGVTAVAKGESFPNMGWLARILPHVEQQPLWQASVAAYAVQPGDPFHAPHTGFMTPIRVYACPADDRQLEVHDTHAKFRVACAGYLGVLGTNYRITDGVLFHGSQVRLVDVADGTSNTLLAGERPPSPDFWYGWWYASEAPSGSGDTVLGVRERNSRMSTYSASCRLGPYRFESGRLDEQCDLFHFWSLHAGGANIAFVDGSVRFLAYSADDVMPALATRSGGETVAVP